MNVVALSQSQCTPYSKSSRNVHGMDSTSVGQVLQAPGDTEVAEQNPAVQELNVA